MVRELAFLAPPVVLGWVGGSLAVRFWENDPSPLWLRVLAGVLMGYLIGGGVVWAVRIFGSLAFGKEAMGLGDVHLMAAVGACVGWIDSVLAFFGAAFVGLAWFVITLVGGGKLQRALPYGPYLAAATVLVLLLKPEIEWLLTALLRVPRGSRRSTSRSNGILLTPAPRSFSVSAGGRGGSARRMKPMGIGMVMRGVAGMAVAAAAMGLGGCSNALKDENAALMQENAELREQKAQLEASLGNEQSQRAALEDEVRQLREALARGGVGTADGFGGDGVTVSRRGSEIVVGVAGDVLFDSGQATIKNSAKKTLDQIASTIRQRYPGHTIRVEGYTDSDPIRKSGWKTNERLSAERALAVESYLVSRGISNDQIYSAAFGASHPKATKKESRRVEIVIVDR